VGSTAVAWFSTRFQQALDVVELDVAQARAREKLIDKDVGPQGLELKGVEEQANGMVLQSLRTTAKLLEQSQQFDVVVDGEGGAVAAPAPAPAPPVVTSPPAFHGGK
jgi:hypothetical protein